MTSEFPAQRASNAEDVSIWWRHHDMSILFKYIIQFSFMSTAWIFHFITIVSICHQDTFQCSQWIDCWLWRNPTRRQLFTACKSSIGSDAFLRMPLCLKCFPFKFSAQPLSSASTYKCASTYSISLHVTEQNNSLWHSLIRYLSCQVDVYINLIREVLKGEYSRKTRPIPWLLITSALYWYSDLTLSQAD